MTTRTAIVYVMLLAFVCTTSSTVQGGPPSVVAEGLKPGEHDTEAIIARNEAIEAQTKEAVERGKVYLDMESTATRLLKRPDE